MNENGNSVSISLEGTETFGERLRELIGNQSVKGFGDKVGISESGLRKCLPPNKSKPAFDKVVAIALETGVTLDWLCSGCGPKFSNAMVADVAGEAEVVKTHNVTGKPCTSVAVSALNEELVMIPGYHVQIPSDQTDISDLPVRRYLGFRRKYLQFRGLDESNLVVVFNKGDAMEATIKDNDSLLVDVSKRKLEDGRIFVVKLGDELYAKRIQKSFDGSVVIISDNKEYQPITIPAERVGELFVFGRVVNVSTDL
uniref:LexA family transcriptional regulator n=1 Tax=Thaumasiovibrio occultus TaxID=1891184 RepID=UPI000B35390D|nr:LexA family transcriptional regulator [Thaumasiovibrio occultus]